MWEMSEGNRMNDAYLMMRNNENCGCFLSLLFTTLWGQWLLNSLNNCTCFNDFFSFILALISFILTLYKHKDFILPHNIKCNSVLQNLYHQLFCLTSLRLINPARCRFWDTQSVSWLKLEQTIFLLFSSIVTKQANLLHFQSSRVSYVWFL